MTQTFSVNFFPKDGKMVELIDFLEKLDNLVVEQHKHFINREEYEKYFTPNFILKEFGLEMPTNIRLLLLDSTYGDLEEPLLFESNSPKALTAIEMLSKVVPFSYNFFSSAKEGEEVKMYTNSEKVYATLSQNPSVNSVYFIEDYGNKS